MCGAIWAHAGEVTLPPALRLWTPVLLSASRASDQAPLSDLALGTSQAQSLLSLLSAGNSEEMLPVHPG